jgi:hypothetical protein
MQAVALRSVAQGPGLHSAITRTPNEFIVEARNTRDERVPSGGDVVKARITGPGPTTVMTIHDLGDGQYRVTYTAPAPGSYQTLITLNGEPIMGSPFRFTALVPEADPAEIQAEAAGCVQIRRRET